MLKVTVLGCGASSGVPLIGCECGVCRSDNPMNKRTRASILLTTDQQRAILIDTSPDLRVQSLRHGLKKLDAVLFTHAHADHLHGIDDLRCYNFMRNASIPCYSDEETLKYITQAFGYVFAPPKPSANPLDWGWYRPSLTPTPVKLFEPFEVAGLAAVALPQKHGGGKSLAFRFGDFAYSTDVNLMPEETLEALQGVDTWIVDCLRYELAPTHAHLEMTLGWIARVKPRRAFLTHMNHGFDYDRLARELPDGVVPCHDGLEIEIRA